MNQKSSVAQALNSLQRVLTQTVLAVPGIKVHEVEEAATRKWLS